MVKTLWNGGNSEKVDLLSDHHFGSKDNKVFVSFILEYQTWNVFLKLTMRVKKKNKSSKFSNMYFSLLKEEN